MKFLRLLAHICIAVCFVLLVLQAVNFVSGSISPSRFLLVFFQTVLTVLFLSEGLDGSFLRRLNRVDFWLFISGYFIVQFSLFYLLNFSGRY